MSASFEDRFVSVDGLRLRYFEAGAGHPVIFLHGGSLGSSADVFRRNLPVFASSGYRAIAFDQPGFGLSDTPHDQPEQQMAQFHAASSPPRLSGCLWSTVHMLSSQMPGPVLIVVTPQ